MLLKKKLPYQHHLCKLAKARAWVLNRDGHKCLKCGATENLTVDHIVPKSRGGTLERNNLQTLCLPCNQEKADNTIDYRKGNGA